MADVKEITERVKGAQNVLVALSKDPNVDEVSAALGLTLMLDKVGKKVTAIYSGGTPDVLKFLRPEETFSADTNALQDFIIALDKDKADHLRYKVDGEYVKVFITPYREAISEDDLEYSYGEFNVDLIIALDVAEEGELDGALVEYGRIMHDAGVVNVTTQEGGKFGDTEWCNPKASSVSEMIAEMGVELGEDAFEKNSATALLTGIVAMTERFANDKTTPETMNIASKLMAAGADQSLVAENIERAEDGREPVMMEETVKEPNLAETTEEPSPAETVEEQPIGDEVEKENNKEEEKNMENIGNIMPTPEAPEVVTEVAPETAPEIPQETSEAAPEATAEAAPEVEPQKPVLETPSELLGDMPKTEESAATGGTLAETSAEEEPKTEEAPVEAPVAEETKAEEPKAEEAPVEEAPAPELPKFSEPAAPAGESTMHKSVKLQPSAEAQEELEKIMHEEPKKNELLDELNKYTGDQAVSGGLKPDVGLSSIDTDSIGKTEVKDYSEMMAAALEGDGGMPNPAVQAAPAVATGPEANHIPEMDYSQPMDVAAEQPPMMQNGMLEPVTTDKPEGAAQEGMTTAVSSEAPTAPGMEQAQEGMHGDVLPPPPAPPVDGGMMPPGSVPEATMASVMPSVPEAPVAPEAPAQPAAPVVQPVAPTIPAAPAQPSAPEAAPAQPQVGPAPVSDDPTAFRIPVM